jgi:hypothetical protein
MIVHEIAREVKVTDERTGKVTWKCKVVRKGMAKKCNNKTVGRMKWMFA